jgi:hypothetical protein
VPITLAAECPVQVAVEIEPEPVAHPRHPAPRSENDPSQPSPAPTLSRIASVVLVAPDQTVLEKIRCSEDPQGHLPICGRETAVAPNGKLSSTDRRAPATPKNAEACFEAHLVLMRAQGRY